MSYNTDIVKNNKGNMLPKTTERNELNTGIYLNLGNNRISWIRITWLSVHQTEKMLKTRRDVLIKIALFFLQKSGGRGVASKNGGQFSLFTADITVFNFAFYRICFNNLTF